MGRAHRSDKHSTVAAGNETERLAALRKLVARANLLVYAAAGIAFVNFLFVEHAGTQLAALGALVLVPIGLDMLGLANHRHVRVDDDEGSRQPEIFTATLVSGLTLALVSLLDRGALLDGPFYALLASGVLVKGSLWCLIDRERLRAVRERGRGIFLVTALAMFVMPSFWAGGGVYQLNKHLDGSPTVWHRTRIVAKEVSSGRTASYSVEVAPWAAGPGEPVEITLRRAEFEALDDGTPVRVGVRPGAFGIGWVSGLSALERRD